MNPDNKAVLNSIFINKLKRSKPGNSKTEF